MNKLILPWKKLDGGIFSCINTDVETIAIILSFEKYYSWYTLIYADGGQSTSLEVACTQANESLLKHGFIFISEEKMVML